MLMADTKIPDIGKYHIIELVGEGAMGVVYRARDSVLDRTVAIKVMNESIARQEDLRKRFLHEAQAAASLQHPNVVTIYDLGDMGGHLFIAMEFVQGVDLEKLLELGEPLSLQSRLDIIIDVLTGLSFAHKRGIVHRDIKPANIRVTEEGRAKIMDFGVAHLASSSMTSTGSFLGTPTYMAPEQITEGKTTPATDIFAVGGVLYQLLTQMKPFEGNTLQNLFFKIITEKPKRVTELMPGLPPSLDRIVEKAMAKEPAERYASALDMANELSAVRAKLSGPSYPQSVSLSASVSSAIEMARKTKETRTRSLSFAAGGAIAAALILVAWSQLVKVRAPAAEARPDSSVASAPSTPVTTAPATSNPSTGTANVIPVENKTTAVATPATLTPAPRVEKTATERTTRSTPPKPVPPKPTPTRIAQQQQQTTTSRSTPSTAAPVTLNNPAPAQSVPVQQQVVTTSPPPIVVQRPVDTPKEVAPPPAPKPATLADISSIVQDYSRAIESRDIGRVRRVYPGITSFQQRSLETFFQRARNINVSFRIEDFQGSTSSAEARLVGAYDYVSSDDDKPGHAPVTVSATFQRDGNVWRLSAIR
jgi:serine/threonine protein kinase